MGLSPVTGATRGGRRGARLGLKDYLDGKFSRSSEWHIYRKTTSFSTRIRSHKLLSEQKQLEKLLKEAMERPGVDDVMRLYTLNKAVVDKAGPYISYQGSKRPRYYADRNTR